MKIGIDARLWSQTGVGRYTRNLIEKLQEIDHKNNYVLFVKQSDRQDVEKKVKEKTFKIVTADIAWHSIEEQIKFTKILNKENLDLMHFTYFSAPALYNKPYVITIHDLIINHFSSGKASTYPSPIYHLKRSFYLLIIKTLAKKARKIIAVSNSTKDEIIDHLGVADKKVEVIYEGADGFFQESSGTKIGEPYFLYVGNVYPHKNVGRLIEAFSGLNNGVKLIFVGKEDYFYKRTKELVERLKLTDSVVFKNEVKDEELAGLYRNAVALVIPSLMEGFGLPALEAMSKGCLVLASNIPSLKEICGDAAIYFNPNDTKDILEKLKESLNIPKDVYTQKGMERAKNFSWKKTAKETLKVYESSINL